MIWTVFLTVILTGHGCSDRSNPSEPDNNITPSDSLFSWIKVAKPVTGAISDIILSPDKLYLFAASSGKGILVSEDDGRNWQFINHGLQDTSINAICIDSLGNIYAATENNGIFRMGSDLDIWQKAGNSDTTIWSLGTSSQGIIFAGGSDSLYRSSDNGQTWEGIYINNIDRPILSFLFFPGGEIFAGQFANGIIQSGNGGTSWEGTGLHSITVLSMGTNRLGHILAGTFYQGGLVSDDAAGNWSKLQNGFGSSGYCFLLNSNDVLYCCGNGDGVFYSEDDGRNWQFLNKDLSDLSVISLCLDSQEHLIAGTENGHLFRSNMTTGKTDPPQPD